MDIRKYFSSPTASQTDSGDASSSSCRSSTPTGRTTDALEEKQSSKEMTLPSHACSSKEPYSVSTLPDKPYQPPVSCIPVQKLPNKTLKFQQRWFNDFPWLHFDERIGGVTCHTCASASRQKLSDLARCAEDTFVNSGFTNWKKGIEKFKNHEKSIAHRLSSENLKFRMQQQDINTQLSSEISTDQCHARAALLKIITSLKYLAEQGLAIRGHDASDGNFARLLQLRSEDDDNLKTWLTRKVSFTSVAAQNEILQIMGHTLVRNICCDVNQMSTQFGLITDGTQDIQGIEQEAVCVRYVDDAFDVHEDLLGIYQVSSTTGMSLSKMLQDALIRLQLPIQHLRAQTYDGASNMSGKYKGCQAEVKKVQPLAMYVHCGAHVTSLITSKAIQNAPFMKNALDNIQELGNLYKSSGKFKHLYLNLHADANSPSPSGLKPICPTRWLTRSPAVQTVLENFSAVLDALQEAARELGSNTASRASGLYKCISSGRCVLGLYVSLPIIKCLESFNRALQGPHVTISGMLATAEMTIQNLQSLRTDHKFKEMFEAAQQKLQQCNLEPVTLPRKHKIPKRLDDGAAPEYTTNSAEEMYRVDFFSVIDSASSNVKEYFTSTDLMEYRDLSSILLTGSFKPEVIRRYPELSDSLEHELGFFLNQFNGNSVEDYRKIFAEMVPEVRRMFPQVERLVRLLLVSPASSCTAERSFSALRRLKTWLRSTMTQQRINHLMICHVHRDRLAELSPQRIAEDFIKLEDRRRQTFGKF